MFVPPAWRRFYLWDCYLVFCVNIAIEIKESGANGGKFFNVGQFSKKLLWTAEATENKSFIE